ncbi:hypothetical protein POVWA2_016210 [Plasmodium ovale wallikeri]|uniref:Uncharacterized protein n=1 Tax=Plasmodium ovale wallikeri TaxID=864142 RepID=A0A1A8YQH2_PLAOA|nr:hypothetical protein POVWA2_016210 [Plasmodium ovale wallikeri]SBT56698.1 hypothetical protein POVWA1_077870 [Plasmodium ovale wallikeri]
MGIPTDIFTIYVRACIWGKKSSNLWATFLCDSPLWNDFACACFFEICSNLENNQRDVPSKFSHYFKRRKFYFQRVLPGDELLSCLGG